MSEDSDEECVLSDEEEEEDRGGQNCETGQQ